MTIGRQKRCPRCEVEKPIEAFSNDKNRNDGKQAICRDCDRIAKDARKRPERLAEIERINYLLTLDPWTEEFIEGRQHYYGWAARKARLDPNFEVIEGESDFECRLRWLIQRTGENNE